MIGRNVVAPGNGWRGLWSGGVLLAVLLGLLVGSPAAAADVQRLAVIAVTGSRWPNADRFIGQVEVGSVAVGLAVDGDCFDAKFAAGTDHPEGDLSAIGDEDAVEHGCWMGWASRWDLLVGRPSVGGRTPLPALWRTGCGPALATPPDRP